MNQDELKNQLARARSVLSAKAKEEKALKDQSKKSLLPYSLFWITNLGVASGLPRYTSILILLGLSILFIPEHLWMSMGVKGKELVLYYPEFIQYFVLNSTFPNSMFMFWFIAPIVLAINTTLFIIHTHFHKYHDFTSRRHIKLRISSKQNDMLFAMQLFMFLLLYIWLVCWTIGPPSFLGGFVPLKSRFAMLVVHGIQVTLVIPAVLTLLTAELRTSFVNFIQNKKVKL